MRSDEVDPPLALVADDDALIRMDACGILEDAGYVAIEASHADEALAFLEVRSAAVELLFTDVDMPGGTMNGFGLARAVSARWPSIGIVVASGRHEPGPGDMPEGAEFVGKPFSGSVVHDRLRRMLPHDRQPPLLRQRI